MKRLIILGLVVALVTVMSAPAALFATGGGNGDNGDNGGCDKNKSSSKCEYKKKVFICHKPGTPAEKTLKVPPSAVAGHTGHGDLIGKCPNDIGKKHKGDDRNGKKHRGDDRNGKKHRGDDRR